MSRTVTNEVTMKAKHGPWNLDRTMILQPSEFTAVVEELNRKARRSINTKMNRVVFRLTTCCGLRASEVSKVALKDILVDVAKPYINIRRPVGKGSKARKVPLFWDAGTLADIRDWKAFRLSQGAGPDDYFVCSQHKDAFGHRIDRHNLRKRFKACCKILGAERAEHITIHHGRHSFISLALHAGKNVVEVQHAAGHSSLGTTTRYAHLVDTDAGKVGNLFDFA
jgi:integrase/recombinase XerD